jgi:hypothetical protein
MDLAEIRSFEWPLIKREARKILENPLVSHPMRAFIRNSVISYSCWLYGNKLPTAHTEAFFQFIQLLAEGGTESFMGGFLYKSPRLSLS